MISKIRALLHVDLSCCWSYDHNRWKGAYTIPILTSFDAIQQGIITESTKGRLVDVFINAIYLFDDKIIIVFNFKNNTKITTKEEVEKSSSGSDLSNRCAPKQNHPNFGWFFFSFTDM